jgi:uncharacterized protein (DUF433 family)
VEIILEKLAAGETTGQIVEAHPKLTEEALRAALAFAAESLKADVVYSVGVGSAAPMKWVRIPVFGR